MDLFIKICICALVGLATGVSITFIIRNILGSRKYITDEELESAKNFYEKACKFSEENTVAILPYREIISDKDLDIAVLVDMRTAKSYSIARKGSKGAELLHDLARPGTKIYAIHDNMFIVNNADLVEGADAILHPEDNTDKERKQTKWKKM